MDTEEIAGIAGLITIPFKIAMFLMVFILIASICSFDSCACGYGPEVRSSIKGMVAPSVNVESPKNTK